MPEQHTAAVALGSNLSSAFGGPAENLREALRRMAALGEVTAVSGFHTTEPVGYVDQPMFVNAAALLRTELAPLELLRALMEIETAMGRGGAGAAAPGDAGACVCAGAAGGDCAGDGASGGGEVGGGDAAATAKALTQKTQRKNAKGAEV
jgi:2-amino-4-hydroxy-6-hydroxymethyldihydropteridine diphosphokinase